MKGISALPARKTSTFFMASRFSVAVAIALYIAAILFTMPAFNTVLGLGLLVYLVLLWLKPFSWLLVIPVALPLLDLTPWTGRVILNEWDLLVLASFMMGLLRWQRLSVTNASHRWILIIVVLWLFSSLWPLLSQNQMLAAPGALMTLPGHSQEYLFYQSKGVLYGLVFFLLWSQARAIDPVTAMRYLFIGFMLSSLSLFVIILWERGVFIDLFSSGPYYQRLRTLFDFTGSYRVTGLFSEMHTGGEVIDGFILLTLPFALVGAGRYTGWIRWLAIIAMAGACYSVVVTFTRATYAAFFVELLVFALISMVRYKRKIIGSVALILIAFTVLYIAGTLLVFKLSGYLGVLSVFWMLCFGLLGSAFSLFRHLNPWLTALAYGVLVCFGVYAQLTSKWVNPDVTGLLMLIAVLTLISATIHTLGRYLTLKIDTLVIMLLAILGIVFIAVASSGYRMTVRMSSVENDLGLRVDHLRDVVSAMNSGIGTHFFGMGPGAFPLAYAINFPDKVNSVGSLRVAEVEGRNVLEMGTGSDLTLAQRVTVKPQTLYSIVVKAKSAGGVIRFGFCERNILFAADYAVNCSAHDLRFEGSDGWQEYEFSLNSKNVGHQSFYNRWPTVFYIKNSSDNSVMIDYVDVRGSGHRFGLLENMDFSNGLDFWFSSNDYLHLPWHIKNTFVSVYFEKGLLGVILLMLLLFIAVYKGLKSNDFSSDSVAFAIALIGLVAVGVLSNPLDSQKISAFFGFFLMACVFSRNASIQQGGTQER
ncbi:MAG: hypothetical protein V7677_14655 [Motiliproteus sp.]